MLFFLQMCQDQPLPVPIQLIFICRSKKLQPTSSLSRFQKKMHLRIMTKRFKMSHAFHRCGNGFFVYDITGSKFYCHMKTLPDQMLQDLNLYLAHQHGVDLSQLLIPHDMKLRFFLLQLLQAFQHPVGVTALRKDDLIIQYRFQHRHSRIRLNAKSLSRICFGKTCDCTDGSCLCLFEHFKFCTGIDTDLICLFLPDLLCRNTIFSCIGQRLLDLQSAAGDLHISKTVSLIISGDLKYPGSEFCGIGRCCHVGLHSMDKSIYSFHLQGRSKEAGKKLSLQDQLCHVLFCDRSCFQETFQKVLLAHGNIFQKIIRTIYFIRSTLRSGYILFFCFTGVVFQLHSFS